MVAAGEAMSVRARSASTGIPRASASSTASASNERARALSPRARRASSIPALATSVRARHGRVAICSCIRIASSKWVSASSQRRIAAARSPSSREADPLHVAARPTTTTRPAYGSSAS